MTTTPIPSPRAGAAWDDDVLGMGPDLTLGYVVGQRRTADAAAAREMRAVTHWADLHRVGRVGSVDPVTEDALTRTVEGMRATASHAGLERQLRLAGEGAFAVDEFAVADLATALGMSEAAGRAYVGQSLELRDRLPSCWAKVMDGTLPAWKGRRVAEQTIPLKPAVAAVLDTPDAHALDHALDRVATTLGDLGDTDTRDVRRAKAFGVLADPQYAMDLEAAADSTGDGPDGSPTRRARRPRREAPTLHVHLHLDAVQARGVEEPGAPPPAQALIARVDRSGRRLGVRTQATIERWLASLVPGAAVTVTPVVDLTHPQ